MDEFIAMMQSGVSASGLSQNRLARELGIAKTALNQTVRGKCHMSEQQLRKFAAATGIDGDALVVASGACFPEGGARARVSELLGENLALRARLASQQEALS